MTLLLRTQDYNDFMIWFAQNHPELYEKYGSNVTLSVHGEGVSIKGDNVPAAAFERIMQLQYEYYQDRGQR